MSDAELGSVSDGSQHGARSCPQDEAAIDPSDVDPSRNAGNGPRQQPFGATHQPGSVPPACVYFLQGRCRNGAACPFSHDQGASKPPCRFFTSGLQCRYGDQCRYAHDPQARGQRGARAPAAGGRGRGRGRGPAGGRGPGGGRGCDRDSAATGADYVISRVLAWGGGNGSDGYGSDDTYENEMDERAENCGFTRDELNDLLCQGVKPWDDDAWDVLAALHDM